jgi:hypothetical protein
VKDVAALGLHAEPIKTTTRGRQMSHLMKYNVYVCDLNMHILTEYLVLKISEEISMWCNSSFSFIVIYSIIYNTDRGMGKYSRDSW